MGEEVEVLFTDTVEAKVDFCRISTGQVGISLILNDNIKECI